MRQVRVEDLLLQSVASLVNLSARRIAKEDERDLPQAKVGIDAVRALVDLLPEEAANEVRNALSDLQMLYARAVEEGSARAQGGGPEQAEPGAAGAQGGGPGAAGAGGRRRRGHASSIRSGRSPRRRAAAAPVDPRIRLSR